MMFVKSDTCVDKLASRRLGETSKTAAYSSDASRDGRPRPSATSGSTKKNRAARRELADRAELGARQRGRDETGAPAVVRVNNARSTAYVTLQYYVASEDGYTEELGALQHYVAENLPEDNCLSWASVKLHRTAIFDEKCLAG